MITFQADIEIADRLEKLRKTHVEEVPTEEEMALRLAKLKGLQSDHYTKPSNHAYLPPDLRTQVEKSEDLLKQVCSIVNKVFIYSFFFDTNIVYTFISYFFLHFMIIFQL